MNWTGSYHFSKFSPPIVRNIERVWNELEEPFATIKVWLKRLTGLYQTPSILHSECTLVGYTGCTGCTTGQELCWWRLTLPQSRLSPFFFFFFSFTSSFLFPPLQPPSKDYPSLLKSYIPLPSFYSILESLRDCDLKTPLSLISTFLHQNPLWAHPGRSSPPPPKPR